MIGHTGSEDNGTKSYQLEAQQLSNKELFQKIKIVVIFR